MRRAASSPNVSKTPQEPATKRQRLSDGTAVASSPTTPVVEQPATEFSEMKWVLDVKRPQLKDRTMSVKHVGYAEIDGPNEDKPRAKDCEVSAGGGRMRFGKRKSVASPSLGSDPTNDGHYELRDLDKARTKRKAIESEDDEENAHLPERRRNEQKKMKMHLSHNNRDGRPDAKNVTCHWCAKKGHISKNCPLLTCTRCDGRGHRSRNCPLKGQR